jgi:hypothetical protein
MVLMRFDFGVFEANARKIIGMRDTSLPNIMVSALYLEMKKRAQTN